MSIWNLNSVITWYLFISDKFKVVEKETCQVEKQKTWYVSNWMILCSWIRVRLRSWVQTFPWEQGLSLKIPPTLQQEQHFLVYDSCLLYLSIYGVLTVNFSALCSMQYPISGIVPVSLFSRTSDEFACSMLLSPDIEPSNYCSIYRLSINVY